MGQERVAVFERHEAASERQVAGPRDPAAGGKVRAGNEP